MTDGDIRALSDTERLDWLERYLVNPANDGLGFRPYLTADKLEAGVDLISLAESSESASIGVLIADATNARAAIDAARSMEQTAAEKRTEEHGNDLNDAFARGEEVDR